MRKFIVHTRSVPGLQKSEDMPTILEVDGEFNVGPEYYSLMGKKEQSISFTILQPEYLYDDKEIVKDGKKQKILAPPTFAMHAIYNDPTEARLRAERVVRSLLERAKRKDGVDFTEEQVAEKLKEIQEVYLSTQ